MVLMMKCRNYFAHIAHIAAITYVPVVGRYSTVTRPLHVRYVRYTASNTQALDILAFWGGVNPFPTPLPWRVMGPAEAPEIVPEAPGYRC